MAVQAKRNAKDTVFRDLFEKPEYLLQLYKALHPEDTDVTEDMLTNVTIENIMTDRVYNDLGFMVRDRLMVLVEAQSTWSVNVLLRAFLYLAQSYQEYFGGKKVNLYGSKPISLPRPEMYVIYTGERQERPGTLSLSEQFFGGESGPLEVTVRFLYGENKEDIIGQYVRFCKVYNLQIHTHGMTDTAVRETIRICRDENVLNAYLSEHEMEAVDIMMSLFDQEYVQEVFGREKFAEGKAEGKAEGVLKTLTGLVRDGLLSIKDASIRANMSEKDFAALLAAE